MPVLLDGVTAAKKDPCSGTPSSSSATAMPYQVAGGSRQFNSRSNDIFSALQSHEAAHEEHEQSHREENRQFIRADPSVLDLPSAAAPRGNRGNHPPSTSASQQNQGELMEYYFRRPLAPPPVSRRSPTDKREQQQQRGVKRGSRMCPPRVPDHVTNPHKYTKYSLEEVSSDEMSDASNRSAALSFLTERREQQQQAEAASSTHHAAAPESEELELPQKIRFRSQSERASTSDKSCGDDASVRDVGRSHMSGDGKLVMSEYVVGVTSARSGRVGHRCGDITDTHPPTTTSTNTNTNTRVSLHYDDTTTSTAATAAVGEGCDVIKEESDAGQHREQPDITTTSSSSSAEPSTVVQFKKKAELGGRRRNIRHRREEEEEGE